MKKTISLLLALVMCLSLYACGSSSRNEDVHKDGNNENIIKETDENTYETPLKAYMEYMSTPAPAWEKIPAVYNGWAEEEIKTIYAVLQRLRDEMEWDESVEWDRHWLDLWKPYEIVFGRDAKMSYEIMEISELSQEQLEEYKKNIDTFVKQREDRWNTKDYIAELDWVKDFQISEQLVKELLDACQAYIDKMEAAVVEEGYRIKMTVTISSSTLDEDHQQDWSTCIYKIDGRWVMAFWDNKSFYDPVNQTIYDMGLF